jgi:hypothetical protein
MIFAARERTRTSAPADLDWRRLGTEGAGVAQAIGFREGRRRGGEGREGKWEATAVGRGAEVEVEVEVEVEGGEHTQRPASVWRPPTRLTQAAAP